MWNVNVFRQPFANVIAALNFRWHMILSLERDFDIKMLFNLYVISLNVSLVF